MGGKPFPETTKRDKNKKGQPDRNGVFICFSSSVLAADVSKLLCLDLSSSQFWLKKKVKRSLGCCVPDSEVKSNNKTQTRSQNSPEKESSQCLAISWEIGYYVLLWIAKKICPLLTEVCQISGRSCWGAKRQPSTNAHRALFIAGQGVWRTFIMLARTSWNFFPQFSYIFWPSLMIQHKVYVMFCLLVFLVWLWNKKFCKKTKNPNILLWFSWGVGVTYQSVLCI